jgi:hypothetical protein
VQYVPDDIDFERTYPWIELKKPILDTILNSNLSSVEQSFKRMKKWQQEFGWSEEQWPYSKCTGLSLEFIKALFKNIEKQKLYECIPSTK